MTMSDPSLRERLGGISVPTMVIWGDSGPLVREQSRRQASGGTVTKKTAQSDSEQPFRSFGES